MSFADDMSCSAGGSVFDWAAQVGMATLDSRPLKKKFPNECGAYSRTLPVSHKNDVDFGKKGD